MNINDVTDGEVVGTFDKDERLDTLTLKETAIITKVAYVKNVVQGVDRFNSRYVSLQLCDKRGYSINAFAFQVSSDVSLAEYLQLKNKIVLLHAEVMTGKGSYSLNILSCHTCDETGYTKNNFVQQNKNLETLKSDFQSILESCKKEPIVSSCVGHIEKLKIVDSMLTGTLSSTSYTKVGDKLECVVRSCNSLLSIEIESESGVNLSKVACIFTILLEGIHSFITDRDETQSLLLNTNSSTTIILFNNLVKSHGLFMNTGADDKLKLEFMHLNEVYMKLSEPKTFISNLITSTLAYESNCIRTRNIWEETKEGNRYTFDCKELNRIL